MGNKNNTAEKEYLKKIQRLPCSIKSNYQYCKCFEKIPFKKLDYTQMNEYIYEFIESDENSSSLGVLENQMELDINILHNNNKYKDLAKNVTKNYKKSKYFVGKYILGTLNINLENISFDKGYKKVFSDIAKSNTNDEEKSSELEDQLETIGYYVPLQIEIGAMFSLKIDDFKMNRNSSSSYNFDSNIELSDYKGNYKREKISEEDMQKLFSFQYKNIKGGDIKVENFEDWKKTVNLENAEVIGYKNLKKITDLIKGISYKLEGAIKIVDEKYRARKKYFEIIESLKGKYNTSVRTGMDTYENGICHEESKSPKIEVFKYECKGDGKFFSTIKKYINRSFLHVIVGYKIISCWGDGTNGRWTLNNDPLLSYEISAEFLSQKFRGERFEVEVYVMEVPE